MCAAHNDIRVRRVGLAQKMYGRSTMTLSPTRVMSPPRNSSAAAQLRRDLLINMENLQRLYTEEKDARKEAEQELIEALQLVKQAQTMAANGRKEAAALRRRLIAVEQTSQSTESALRRQLADAEANSRRNNLSSVPRAQPAALQQRRPDGVRDELVTSDTAFVRK